MLFQATNIIPDVRSGIGLGTIDATLGMTITWQVNGDYPVMTAYRVIIYQNNAASTQLYTTGKKTPPGGSFNGTDALGEPQFFSFTIAAATLAANGITNGHEYKFIITQYYTESGVEKSIQQTSASVFTTRATPSFSLATIPSSTVTSPAYTFSVSYSQAQGDTLDWVRYRINEVQGGDSVAVYDSHSIYGASVFSFTYDGFLSGSSYAVRANGQTSSGVDVDTGWIQFSASYTVTTGAGALVMAMDKQRNAIKVALPDGISWGSTPTAMYYYRIGGATDTSLTKIATTSGTDVMAVWDYGIASGQGPYGYMVRVRFANNTEQVYQTDPATPANPQFYRWTLLSCAQNSNGEYIVQQEFHFRNNLDSGAVSNNNNPSLLNNFTPYPTVQLSPQNYLSGTLSALVGVVNDFGGYTSDTLAVRQAIAGLSTTQNALFLKSSKGDVMEISTSGPISFSTAEGTGPLAQTITVPWVELGDASTEAIIQIPD